MYLIDAGSQRHNGNFDDFIQGTHGADIDAVAEEIATFFRDADPLNRCSLARGIRDRTSLIVFHVIGLFWPCSYLAAAFHVLRTAAERSGFSLWRDVGATAPVLTFFGAFFIAHCLGLVIRNAMFTLRFTTRIGLEFMLPAAWFIGLAAITAYSITNVETPHPRTAVSSILAVAAYLAYFYARRVRGELTSLSELKTQMEDPERRMRTLDVIGRLPLGSNAYPLWSFQSKSVFVSYTHDSDWSHRSAAVVHRCLTERGLDVFLDRSSIPPGALWRQHLLRSLGECGYFIVVLDPAADASEWVLTESAYAATLRKNLGKPRILVIVRDAEELLAVQRGPFGALFRDLFELPIEQCDGAGLLVVNDGALSAESIQDAMNRIRPMCLLW